MVCEIPLTQGLVALVDDEDYETVSQFRWYAGDCKGRIYARRDIRINGKRVRLFMHKVLVPVPDPLTVDHINGNGLDNRRCNLRPATRREQAFNHPKKSSNSSGYIGVWLDARHGRWMSVIRINGVRKYLGQFDTPEQAAKVYDRVARETRGEFAKLNFPEVTA